MSTIKVSILIPFYNAEPFLERTIQSALDQSYRNIELILVDDGSTDRSLSIARSFASDRVKVFTQKNSGACRARNKAFEESTGDYIQYLDGDDLLSKDKIESQLKLLGGLADNIILSSRFIRFYDDNTLPLVADKRGFLDCDWDNPIEWLIHACEGRGMGATSIWLTPRHLIQQAGCWDERLSVNQDGEFFCRVLLRAKGIRFSENGVLYYRSGLSDSVSQKITPRKASDLLLSYNLCAVHMLEREDSARVRRAIASRYASFMYSFFDTHPNESAEAYRRAISLGIKKLPVVGGRNFCRMAKIVGFKNSLRIRSAVRRLVAT